MLNQAELNDAIERFMSRKSVDYPWLSDRKRSGLGHVSSHELFTSTRQNTRLRKYRKSWLNRIRMAT